MDIARKICAVHPKARFAPGSIVTLKRVGHIIPCCSPQLAEELGYPEVNRTLWNVNTMSQVIRIFQSKEAKVLSSKAVYYKDNTDPFIVHVIEACKKRILVYEEALEWAITLK